MPHVPSPGFQSVCPASEVPVGAARMVVLAGRMIGLFNVGGQIYALDNACPHAGASLAHGSVDGDTVICRIHHWRFRISDGKYLDEDKPRCDVPTIPVRVVAGMVQVAVEVNESPS